MMTSQAPLCSELPNADFDWTTVLAVVEQVKQMSNPPEEQLAVFTAHSVKHDFPQVWKATVGQKGEQNPAAETAA
jgi:hypothetical protein